MCAGPRVPAFRVLGFTCGGTHGYTIRLKVFFIFILNYPSCSDNDSRQQEPNVYEEQHSAVG